VAPPLTAHPTPLPVDTEFTIQNSTTALWTWHRNQDAETVISDSVTVVNTL